MDPLHPSSLHDDDGGEEAKSRWDMVLSICHAGMDPEKGESPQPILLQSWRKGGLCPSPPFSGVSQSKMIQAR